MLKARMKRRCCHFNARWFARKSSINIVVAANHQIDVWLSIEDALMVADAR
jgi:hypothetical protein